MYLLFLTIFLTTPTGNLPGDISGPSYPFEPYKNQSSEVLSRITKIISPVFGFPAMVEPSGAMALITFNEVKKVYLLPASCGSRVRLQVIKSTKTGKYFRSILQIPPDLPRQGYHLKVHWTDGSATTEKLSVRSTGFKKNRDIKIALYSDHQLRDPSWKLFNGFSGNKNFPKRGESKLNRAITKQQFHELEILDPDMIIHLGDLLFGLDYPEEYQMIYKLWQHSVLPGYFIPGNHDAYATYTLKMPSFSGLSLGMLKCKSLLPGSTKDWYDIFKFIVCLYGNIKNELFNNLKSDGLVWWKRWIGPLNQSIRVGKFQFIFLNTYAGTPERRHSFSIYIKALGYHLGAPAVDNYGGYLSDADLKWVKTQLTNALENKLTPVIFAHHDPRGNLSGDRYHHNEPFPTSPIGADHFEEWNFDGKEWDSDTTDKRVNESITENNAVKLLKLVAASGGFYISGHIHKDGQWVYPKGKLIDGKIRALKDITFIKVTTGASSKKDDGYWGIRTITAKEDGTLTLNTWSPKKLSIPSGNRWYETHNSNGTKTVQWFKNSDAFTEAGNVSLCLPYSQTGYQLKSDGKTLYPAIVPFPKGEKNLYTFKVSDKGTRTFTLEESVKNSPPQIRVSANGTEYSSGASVPAGKWSAKNTVDPEKDSLHSPYWIVGNKNIQGFLIDTRGISPSTKVIFRVRDNSGVWTQGEFTVIPYPGKHGASSGHGCSCLNSNHVPRGVSLGVFFLALLFTAIRLWFHFRQRKTGDMK
ncbi:MAG: metallophosphoesterase [Deltaproteobacteria bacterium]|nr:metallophosphoesterase [Deltaproteobacteria bacterium]